MITAHHLTVLGFLNTCDESTGCTLLERGLTFGGIAAKEHVAGPGCRCTSAYSGWRVSVEEMRGCRAIQALVPKEQVEDWQPESDDEDFERESDFCLSGVGDGSPDTAPLENVGRIRHGLDNVWVTNICDDYDDVGNFFYSI